MACHARSWRGSRQRRRTGSAWSHQIPTYGVQGLFHGPTFVRMAGDERMLVRSFYEGQTFLYEFVKGLSRYCASVRDQFLGDDGLLFDADLVLGLARSQPGWIALQPLSNFSDCRLAFTKRVRVTVFQHKQAAPRA